MIVIQPIRGHCGWRLDTTSTKIAALESLSEELLKVVIKGVKPELRQ
jgi:hypothetical protein